MPPRPLRLPRCARVGGLSGLVVGAVEPGSLSEGIEQVVDNSPACHSSVSHPPHHPLARPLVLACQNERDTLVTDFREEANATIGALREEIARLMDEREILRNESRTQREELQERLRGEKAAEVEAVKTGPCACSCGETAACPWGGGCCWFGNVRYISPSPHRLCFFCFPNADKEVTVSELRERYDREIR